MQSKFSFKSTVPAAAKLNLSKWKRGKAARDEVDDEPRMTRRQKLILIAAAAAVVLGAGYYFFPTFGGAGGGIPIAATVSADELLRDFSINRVGAAKKYTIGHVVVSGEVTEVFRDKRPRIRFKSDDKSKFFVEAVFPHVNDLKEIEKNKKLTVRGECEGWQKNIVEITLCKVVAQEAAAQ